MIPKSTLYFFSPTGGTEKTADIFCNALANETIKIDILTKTETLFSHQKDDVVIFAVPVFAGRIPTPVNERISRIQGNKAKAITLAIYGNRDIDDALLELNDVVTNQNFDVIASASLVCHHSLVNKLAQNRPDQIDIKEITDFAEKITQKILKNDISKVDVPGKRPYKELMPSPITPIVTSACEKCGHCADICPVQAIEKDNPTETNSEKCIHCKACVARCPKNARQMPQPFIDALSERLKPFESIRNKNILFI